MSFSLRRPSHLAVIALFAGLVLGWSSTESRAGDAAGKPRETEAKSKQPLRIPIPNGQISFLAFIPDGPALAYQDYGQADALILCEPSTGKELRRFPLDGGIVAFAPDGKRIALRGKDKTLRVRTLPENKELCLLDGVEYSSSSISFSPDSKYLVAILRDAPKEDHELLHVWDVGEGKEVARLGSGPWGDVGAFSFAGDSHTVATEHHKLLKLEPGGGRFDKVYYKVAIRLWDVVTGKDLGQVGTPFERQDDTGSHFRRYGQGLIDVGARPDGWRIRTAPDGTFALYPPFLSDGNLLQDFEFPLPDGNVYRFNRRWDAAERPAWEFGSIVSNESTFHLWNCLLRFLDLEDRHQRVCAVSPDGRWLASWNDLPRRQRGEQVLIWDLSTLRLPTPRPTDRELEAIWQDLGGGQVAKARRAAAVLAAFPKQSMPWLRGRIRPVLIREPEWLRLRLAELDHDEFAVRHKAQQQLVASGTEIAPALRAALKESPSLEAHRRIERVLELITGEGSLPPDTRREMWVVELLEQLGTPEAQKFLKELAGGDPGAWLTHEAKESLQRLGAVAP